MNPRVEIEMKRRICLPEELRLVEWAFNAPADKDFLWFMEEVLKGGGFDCDGCGCHGGEQNPEGSKTGFLFFFEEDESLWLPNTEALIYMMQALQAFAEHHAEDRERINYVMNLVVSALGALESRAP